MKVLFYISILLFSFSCADSSVEIENAESGIVDSTVTDSIIMEDDALIITKIAFPAAVLDDPCLPYPSEQFLHYLEFDSLSFIYSKEYNLLYNYAVAHFDSLSSKKHFKVVDEYDMGKYHWEQNFSNGIVYEEFFGGEGGPIAILKTECSDRLAVFSTLNPLVNHGSVYPEGSYPDDATWNEDSTAFSPEGAGCYYDIIKNDTTGFYYIDNYCGC